jgi:hypothetical protein
VDVWYSDTVTLQWEGCNGVLDKGGKAYQPTIAAVVVNPGNKWELADFAVKQLS